MLPIWGVSGLCFSHCEADSFLLYVADLARVSSETMGQAPSTRVLKWPTEDLSEPAYIPLADASDDTITNQRLVQLLAEEKALESQYRALMTQGPPEIRYTWELYGVVNRQFSAAQSAQEGASVLAKLDSRRRALYRELEAAMEGNPQYRDITEALISVSERIVACKSSSHFRTAEVHRAPQGIHSKTAQSQP